VPTFNVRLEGFQSLNLHAPPQLAKSGYPWIKGSPQADLTEARRLIEKHGYWRRRQELEDAERALGGG
jgi:hypothetical protein